MARETIFETQEINDFAYSSSWGAYAWHTTPSPFVLEVGETYIISWDGTEFERTAFDFSVAAPGAVGVGNAYLAGVSPEPDLVPFIIAYLDTTDYIEFVTSSSGGHTVAIYKEIAEPEKIVIKDPDGNDVEYPDKPMIRLNTTKGTALYSKGEVLDSITIDPDFSAGDMTVSAPDGYLVKSAVIAKPSALVPENIAKDVDIAGIVGTHEGGGGGGDLNPYIFALSAMSLQHNLSATGSLATGTQISISPNSELKYISARFLSSDYVSGSAGTASSKTSNPRAEPLIITKTEENITISSTRQMYFSSKYQSWAYYIEVGFALPGYYLREGNVMYADEKAVEFPKNPTHMLGVTKADLSNAKFTELPGYAFIGDDITEILLPPTLEKITSSAFTANYHDIIVDFSRHTFIPTVNSTAFLGTSSGNNLIIRVPSNLYNEWIAATNWSKWADYTVAV